MPIIVNADDFGKNEEVSRAVLEAFEEKLITRTTLMVNMPYADKAVELAKQKGFFKTQTLYEQKSNQSNLY